ncbi:hypothetical protein JQ824_05295 [Brachyspira hyodysenteriae]|uniref:hypothetical protein n=1 Tax=Brachyspira hyodysenteriae TaxID=159 RepID=UPI00063DA6CF|nr:hypothetical protein [Brachyspira hyodysenteriae]KLI23411.1 hypothetical protein SR30_09890 [Brachyspira hyodysenteriae]KLI25881.1 hypothetical protein SU43_02995 [Brachyspira hyodysenteriae]MBT8719651.1 hypothetical protein [Brachyspira hyodysenteriae]MBT8729890.1 hypothetical protein [Brachyspira hyodysenteriae]MBT8732059.1 hypothetical protein [Brachyspira hyodysenteriae]
MLLKFFVNKLCSYSLDRKKEKVKRKIDDLNAYIQLASKEIDSTQTKLNSKLYEITDFLNGIVYEAKITFKPIVQSELHEVSDIIKKSYDLLFVIIGYNAKMKIFYCKKNYYMTEINFLKKRKGECFKIIKTLSLSKKKDERLKWFNEANNTNIKTIDELRSLRESHDNIDLLIDLCERDLKNYRVIKKLREYIKTADKKIDNFYKRIENIDIEIKKFREKVFQYLEDYNKLYSDFLDILNREYNIEDIFPSYLNLLDRKNAAENIKSLLLTEAKNITYEIKSIKGSPQYYNNKNTLISQRNNAWDNFNSSNEQFLKLNEKVEYYNKTFDKLLKSRRKSILDLYHTCSKKIVRCKKGGYLIILNKDNRDSNIFISDYSNNKEAIN